MLQALLCVDGVALAPHRKVDVKELAVDVYVSQKPIPCMLILIS